jgi:hypothetical protein
LGEKLGDFDALARCGAERLPGGLKEALGEVLGWASVFAQQVSGEESDDATER